MPDSSTTPEPDPDTDSAPAVPASQRHHTERDPAEPAPPVPAGPPEAPRGDRHYLRPVDWDGHFSSMWAARDDRDLTRELAAEHERESDRRELDQMWRELRDEANAEANTQDARERERADEWVPRDDARSRLFEKTSKLDRASDEADQDAEPDDPTETR
ncbi:conserved hypothetical protein [Frankia canadensis]|uniref:Uncharacterized protein n=1 Tax=Frankia canadensis TaxID=1836972 RepID=A0A2I2KJC9_9ACTN|nr:hypothetical protein [Frankia canadensis]SNQ45756.1 conserved hypothetical protein [Frankia canadensis]SOU53046.1 conserved hypothetical protein [Frankia canadensis]